MLDLIHKDFQLDIYKMFKELREVISKELKDDNPQIDLQIQ